MKVSKDFELREFVDPVTYQIRGDRSIELIDNRLIKLTQFFRDYFGVPTTVNNWHLCGHYNESGLRTWLTKTGAKYSQHKYGRAGDLKLEGLDPEEVRQEMRRNWPKFKAAGLTTIEKDTPTWNHISVQFTGLETLYEVPYK
jgi:hypothetical protein